jgi:hypothetical protein
MGEIAIHTSIEFDIRPLSNAEFGRLGTRRIPKIIRIAINSARFTVH